MKSGWAVAVSLVVSFGFSGSVVAQACEDAGPQAPRDITSLEGTNPQVFSAAPAPSRMALCNIHFHRGAEHRGPGFDRLGDEGASGGYVCASAEQIGSAPLPSDKPSHCEGVVPGDTIEVHWVFSTCAVDPGPGLGSCLSESCSNPQLRVEAQVFLVGEGEEALDFASFGRVERPGSYSQPAALPGGDPVVYLGSTTGPKYDDSSCSPFQVTWSVRPGCALLDGASLSTWCEDNVFEEDHAHEVRILVTDPALLSPIESGS